MNNTTRSHPRTLAQAFPRDHANAITHYAGTHWADFAVRMALFFGVLAVIAALIWGSA
jgi:hypothetical protein